MSIVADTATANDAENNRHHICQDDYALIYMPSGNVKMVPLRPNTLIQLGKFGKFMSDELFGKPFGAWYEICNVNKIKPIDNWDLSVVEETDATNQLITDDASVQRLSREEIESLKQENLSGDMDTDTMIQRVIASHSAFEKKTEYSKAKYIQRKKKKFLMAFKPVQPTIFSLVQFFFGKHLDKIKGLRIDTLSQLLSLGNIRPDSKLLVLDDTQGMIIAAIAERMGGHGTIITLHDGAQHNYDVLRYCNFSDAVMNSIYSLPLSVAFSDDTNEPTPEELEAMREKSRIRIQRRQIAKNLLDEGEFDGLVISSRFPPETVIETLTKYVAGSRPIVIYSQHKESLMAAAAYMRRSKDFLCVNLTESFLRRYQVLPGRIHPEMNTTGGGGYLLNALRVIESPLDASDLAQYEGHRQKRAKKAPENQ